MDRRLPSSKRSSKRDDVERWVNKSIISREGKEFGLNSLKRLQQQEIPSEGILLPGDTTAVPVEDRSQSGSFEDEEEYSQSGKAGITKESPKVTSKEVEVISPGVKTYYRAVKRLGIVPLRKVLTELGKEKICFGNLGLTSRDMNAICAALVKEHDVTDLDFSGNLIGGPECDYLVRMLTRVNSIQKLDVCNNRLSGRGICSLAACVNDNDNLTFLDLSGNLLLDSDASAVANFLTRNYSLRTLLLNHNQFGTIGGRLIGNAIGKNKSLQELRLRWNHLRRDGAIGIAQGLEINRSLKRVDLGWNGFGFEGCVALSDALAKNCQIEELDISSNRINPPALMELIRGLARNKALKTLRIGKNPISASFTCVLLNTVRRNPTMALECLDMEGIVVDRNFQALLDDTLKTRNLHVIYDVVLPAMSISREEMLRHIQTPDVYNLDPLHMFFLLKQKMRVSDFFNKINKDQDHRVSRDELNLLFKEAGLPVTGSVVDAIVEFMDTDGDGSIDMAELMSGDKKMKKISRPEKPPTKVSRKKNSNKYSRSFRKAAIDPVTLSVKVTKPAAERLAPALARNLTLVEIKTPVKGRKS